MGFISGTILGIIVGIFIGICFIGVLVEIFSDKKGV